jgi:PelA/Pel-15E family pectate lyase
MPSPLGLSLSLLLVTFAPPPQGGTAQSPLPWGSAMLRQKPDWYATSEARKVADSVLLYQSTHGAWPKNTDLTKPATPQVFAEIQNSGSADTIDNGATTIPMRFLALMATATGEARYREAFERGLDYLFTAQYPNGGWPQFFPLREGYYSHVTYNDDAMVNVLTLLRDTGAALPPYAFVSRARAAKASAAVAHGVDVILKTQLKQDGKLVGWCAQYDEKTLVPAWARKYEPPSLSGNESVGLTRFLMEIEKPTPEIVAAIEGSVAWLGSVPISGLRYEDFTGADGKRDRRVVTDPSAPRLWARFYELGTNRPLFLGRDSVFHYALNEIEQERRGGYAYYGVWPETLLTKDYPRWRAKHKTPKAAP